MCVTLFSLLRFSLVFVHVPHSFSSLPLGLAAGGTLVCFCFFLDMHIHDYIKTFYYYNLCCVCVFAFLFVHILLFAFICVFVCYLFCCYIIFFLFSTITFPFISHKLIHDTPHPKFK